MAPPSFDEEWTIEGKVGHALLEKMLNEREDNAARYVGTAVHYETDDNVLVAAVVKPDTARAVQIALDEVYEILETDPGATIWIERKVEIPSSSVPDRLWGTADIIIYLPKFSRLVVIDYKHGAGIFVDVIDNLQTRGYSLAALLTVIDDKPVAEVWLGIVQPRAFSLEGSIRWDKKVSVLDLFDFWKWLDDKAELTLDERAPFTPNDAYCRWCPAASICVAYEQKALQGTGAATFVELLVRPMIDPKKLPLDRIAILLKAEPYLRGILKAARNVALGAAYRGYDVPDFKLVHGKASRTYYGDHEQIAETLSVVTGLPLDRFYPRTLVPMTEAEQTLIDCFRDGVVQQEGETKKSANMRANKASELARELMAQLTLKDPSDKITLAPSTDPRPRVDAAASSIAGLIHVDPQE